MKLFFLFIIIAVIASTNSYDYKLINGSKKDLGTLSKGIIYTFYFEAKTGQEATITFTSSSIQSQTKNPTITVYSYINGDTYYSEKNEYDMFASGNTLSMKFNVKSINKDYISHIIYEFTPIYNMDNTEVLAKVYGTSDEDINTTVSSIALMVILLPIIIVIVIIIVVCTICCCFCQTPKPVIYVPVNNTRTNNQPLYPVQPQQQPYQQPQPYQQTQPYQQPPGYVPPYP